MKILNKHMNNLQKPILPKELKESMTMIHQLSLRKLTRRAANLQFLKRSQNQRIGTMKNKTFITKIKSHKQRIPVQMSNLILIKIRSKSTITKMSTLMTWMRTFNRSTNPQGISGTSSKAQKQRKATIRIWRRLKKKSEIHLIRRIPEWAKQ